MNIAIFADIHGRILLCFKLCARWQRMTGETIDLILQAGDMGAFPDINQLDRATRLHAEHDPTELGFLNQFVSHDAKVAATLNLLSCNLVFVRGNHEGHNWLDSLEREATGPIFPVDAYNRIYCLKTGEIYSFRKGREEVNILGIGRIGLPERASNAKEAIYIQPYEVEHLSKLKSQAKVDVLLTHDTAPGELAGAWHDAFGRTREIEPVRGMKEIRQTLNRFKPAYHFFGHIGGPFLNGLDSNGQTAIYKLSDLIWRPDARRTLEAGSMGLLRWNSFEDHSFEIVAASWLEEYDAYTWEYLD